MKFGYMPDSHGGPYDQPPPDRERSAEFTEHLVREAVTAEQSGFDGAFVPERHARTETMWPQPLMALMAFAMKTERIKLGTYVLQPAYYNPAHLAEMVALVDLASRGRLILGVGTGYHPGYFSHFGEPYDKRLGRFLESLDFMKKAFTEDKFDWDGKYWQMEGVRVNPKPYQQPMPRLWFGSTGPNPARRAAKRGAGIGLLAFYTPLEEHRKLIDLYRQECEERGTTPQVCFFIDGYVGESYEEAKDTFGPLWVDEVRYYIKWGMLGPTEDIPSIDHATYENLEKYMVLGDAEQCGEAVERIREALALGEDDWLIFRSRIPQGPSFPQVIGSIERFGRDVIPLVRKEATSAAAT
jgi:alkanesulfonate monooxygenase SsuD/methylene tetrahydromethanopterin reductase-like flavin-dependent oxidoreductase (luciferase family)